MPMPAWLNPWGEAKRQLAQATAALQTAAEATGRAEQAEAERDDLRGQMARTRAQYEALTASSGTTPVSGDVEFVICGIDRAPVGKRLIASRQLRAVNIGMTPADDPPPQWVVSATMGNAAFIDRPTYQAALAFLNTMWASADAEAAAIGRGLPAPAEGSRSDVTTAPALEPGHRGSALVDPPQATHPGEQAAADDQLSVRKNPRRPPRNNPPG